MEARENIRTYIASNLVVFDEEGEFSDSDNIFEKGLVNSLFAMKLLNYIENEFKITVDDDDIEISNFSSIDNMMNLIQKKQGVVQ